MRIRFSVALVVVAFVLGVAVAGPAMAASVSAVDFNFVPQTTTINAGDSVTWTNNGTSPHTATADDGSFDSGSLNPGESFTHTFASAGTIAYHCNFHESLGMVGTVVVQAGGTEPGPLPNTGAGSTVGPFVWLGLLFLVSGGAVLYALRRRRA